MAERQQLADCIRMLEKAEIIDFNGHCSVRVAPDRILINQGNCQRSQVQVDDIVSIDMQGNLLEGKAKPPLEFHLHTGLYRARSDISAIVHAHPKWSTFLTMTGHAYKPVFAQGVLPGKAPVLDTPASINTREMADELAKVLGDRPAVLMKSHGAATVGKSIVEAFVLAVYLEENAYRQYMALQIGSPYVFTKDERKAAIEKLWTDSLFQRTWDHYKAKLG
ncbi:MAG: class II aldolase/adducin family protein [Alphaproteobacteria bacterium]|nr:class II aldolase/adducin family protein [Alphaproteobacteria bacterium]